jgi:threonine dehydratase
LIGLLVPSTVAISDVLAARQRIAASVRETPLVRSASLSNLARGDVFLKLESQQLTNSFKARGALNAVLQVPSDTELIVTASGGNHGRAIAWAAERVGYPALVFTPQKAPRAKTDAIVAHGAELRADARTYEEAERRAKEFAVDQRARFISPYNHPHVIAGAATVALELLHQNPALDTILVPIGGGGLISGVALAVKSLHPSIRIVGVEVEASAAFSAALAAGRIVPITVTPTIADGLGGNVDPETITWPLIRQFVDHVVVVGESDVIAAVRHLSIAEGVTAEGAGATTTAAVLSGAIDLTGRKAAVLVTGGNIDSDTLEFVMRS